MKRYSSGVRDLLGKSEQPSSSYRFLSCSSIRYTCCFSCWSYCKLLLLQTSVDRFPWDGEHESTGRFSIGTICIELFIRVTYWALEKVWDILKVIPLCLLPHTYRIISFTITDRASVGNFINWCSLGTLKAKSALLRIIRSIRLSIACLRTMLLKRQSWVSDGNRRCVIGVKTGFESPTPNLWRILFDYDVCRIVRRRPLWTRDIYISRNVLAPPRPFLSKCLKTVAFTDLIVVGVDPALSMSSTYNAIINVLSSTRRTLKQGS